MQDADGQQQGVAPKVQQDRTPVLGLGPFDEEQDAGPKEEGEEPHELLVDEDLTEDAHQPVQPGFRASRAEVQVGNQSELEGNGVHQQDAQHRRAPDEIEAGYSRRFRDGAGISLRSSALKRLRRYRWTPEHV